MISDEDLEEVWERAITVARTEVPNRWEFVVGGGLFFLHVGSFFMGKLHSISRRA